MKVGLFGATGLVGSAVLDQLLDDPACDGVTVWARSGTARQHPRLDWITIDFDELPDAANCTGLDVVLCCLGTTTAKAGKVGLEKVDLQYVLAAAEAARRADIKRFAVISSLGASAASPVHYSRTKGRMENGLMTMGFECLDILRPSLLLGSRDEKRPGEEFGQRLAPAMNALLCGPLRRYRAIEGSDVAAAMITVAKAAEPGVHIRFLPL